LNAPKQQDSLAATAAVLVDLMPGTCSSSSSEDEEVAAINIGCKQPPALICSQQSTGAYTYNNRSNSSADDLDLELIEQN